MLRPGLGAIFERCYRHGTSDTKVNCTYCKIEKDVKEQYDGQFPVRVEIDVEPPCVSLNRKEAAQFIGVSVSTLKSWHSTKKYSLPFTRVERKIGYLLSDLKEFKIHHRPVKFQPGKIVKGKIYLK